jgi:O-antigen ligase
LGSGGGTFEDIYARYENPARVDSFYVNHAHNDFLEILLEYGVVGALLLLLFLLWWVRNAHWLSAGRKPDYFAFAATLASAAILAHSLVDYPLRTAAISVLLAACCSLMARSPAPEAGNSTG